MSAGQVITFYSYKGGVGRSFALANTAVLLARWGYRVLCIDWDLEAPGLSYFFDPYLGTPPESGLLEMIEEVRERSDGPPSALKHRSTVHLPEGVRLDLIAAGKQDATYVSRLQDVDWDELYTDHDFGAVLEDWRDTWMRNYDVVLVDSRTGITDAGAICTAQVPDALVFAFTANQQNIDGVLDIVDQAMKARDGLPYDRPLLLTVPLLSRFDASKEYDLSEAWRKNVARRVATRMNDWAPKGYDADELLQRITIPYFAKWSFGEDLPTLHESHRSSEKVSYSIASLAALLARRLEDARLLIDNRDSYVDSAVQAAPLRNEADVVLSYVPATASVARELAGILHESGLSTAPRDVGPALTDPDRRRDLIDSGRHLVVLVGDEPDPLQEQDIAHFLRHSVNSAGTRFTMPVVTSSTAARNLPPLVQNLRSFNLARGTVHGAAQAIIRQIRDESSRVEFGDSERVGTSRYDVLLSYAHVDREWALVLAQNLERLGLAVWLDQWELVSGQLVALRLQDGLANADVLVPVVSEWWVNAGWVGEEFAAAMAVSAGGPQRVIPVLLGDVALPPFLASRLYIDFRTTSSPRQYTDGVGALARAVLRRGPDQPLESRGRIALPDSAFRSGGNRDATLTVSADRVLFSTLASEAAAPPASSGTDLDQLLWELRGARGRAGLGLVTRQAATAFSGGLFPDVAAALRAVGRALGEQFTGGAVGRALVGEILSARAQGAVLRLSLETEDPRWADLPWEALTLPGMNQPLALAESVEFYRKVRREQAPVHLSVPGPLRILVVVAGPDRHGMLLDYEYEVARILDAVSGAHTGHGAHVRVLEWGSVAEIRAALEQERFHVLHLSCHAGPGVLFLETPDGRPDHVDARRFVDEVLPAGRGVPLIVLSGCRTAVAPEAPEEASLLGIAPLVQTPSSEIAVRDVAAPRFPVVDASARDGLARELLARGVPAVLAMSDDVTDQYVTELAGEMYADLARAERPNPLAALSRARRQLEARRLRLPADDPHVGQPEWSAPALFLAGPPLPLFDAGVRTERVPSTPDPVLDDRLVARKSGEFVGRRTELRRLLAVLREADGAGVLIHGIGGIGMSTLAAELVRQLDYSDRLVVAVPAAVDGAVESVLGILRQQLLAHCVSQALPEDDSLRRVAAALSDATTPWRDRWDLVRRLVLPRLRLLLVLDGAEVLLTRSDGVRQLAEPELADLLAALAGSAPHTQLLVTSRHPFPLPRRMHRRFTTCHLGPLSLAETRKLMWRLPGLDALSPEEKQRVYRDIGGHPRALEYLDALLRGGRARFPDVALRLEDSLERRGTGDPGRWLAGMQGDLDAALAETVALVTDDVQLDALLDELDGAPTARRLLEGIAVYRTPVDGTGAAWQLSGPIIETDALEADSEEGWGLPLETGGRFRTVREEGPRLPVELVEPTGALRQLMDLGLVSPAPQALGELEDRLSGLLAHRWMAQALASRTPAATLAHAHRLAASYWQWRVESAPQPPQTAVALLIEARDHHHQAGDIEPADRATRRVCSQLHIWGARDWEERLIRESLDWFPPHSQARATYLRRLGVIARLRGCYQAAAEDIGTSLAISEALGNRLGIAAALRELGNIAQVRGHYAEAESRYLKALTTSEELGDRIGIAATTDYLGRLARDRGKYAEAEQHHRKALTLSTELGDRIGITTALRQLGITIAETGRNAEAETLCRNALDICEELGNRFGIAATLCILGALAQWRGEYTEAEQHYRRALTFDEELGDRLGIATTLHYWGLLENQRDRPLQGIRYSLRAFQICRDMGVPVKPDLPPLATQLDLVGEEAFRSVLREHLPQESADEVFATVKSYAEAH